MDWLLSRQSGENQRKVLDGLRSSVGRRFAIATVTCSGILAFIMTSIQLVSDYRSEMLSYNTSFSKIHESMLPGLTESIWLLDDALIASQLSGIAHFEGITRVEITGTGSEYLVENSDTSESYAIEFPIIKSFGDETTILGTLVIHANNTHIKRQVFNRAVIILLTNLLKTICVAFAILIIYQQLVGQHISRLVNFVNNYDPESKGQRLSFARSPTVNPQTEKCEFLELERSINKWSQATENYIDQLYRANREQAEFTYAISHDLKSPTNTMSMLIDELEEIGPVGEGGYDIVADMKLTNRRMGQLVVDVLDYSHLIEAEQTLERVELAEIVSNVLKDLAADIAEAKAKICVGVLPSIQGHPTHLRMVFQNLIANAVKFRKPERDCRVEISGKILGQSTEILVRDNGIGIPEKFHDTIFGLFKQLHTRSDYEGSGLGLTVCRRIVTNHGGTISVKPGIDGGAAFELIFPRVPHEKTH